MTTFEQGVGFKAGLEKLVAAEAVMAGEEEEEEEAVTAAAAAAAALLEKAATQCQSGGRVLPAFSSSPSSRSSSSSLFPISNPRGQRRPLAFVLGTRKGDPNSRGQETFAPSSDWLPPFMRVNPVSVVWCCDAICKVCVDVC
jgi:hypothetical protein